MQHHLLAGLHCASAPRCPGFLISSLSLHCIYEFEFDIPEDLTSKVKCVTSFVFSQNAAEPAKTAALKEQSKEPLQAAQSARNRNPEAMIPIESKKVSCISHCLECLESFMQAAW